MLITAEQLESTAVMSLQTGTKLAETTSALIDPRNLMIIAFELSGSSLDEHPSFLLVEDIREFSNLGFIVDSSDEFVGLNDVIRVEEVYSFKFTLIDTPVIDQKKTKLGKVISYAIEPGSFMIKQLRVRRPLLKSFNDTELLIDRDQIQDVKDDAITIHNDEREPQHVKQAAKAFTNPFRAQHAQPEPIKIDKS